MLIPWWYIWIVKGPILVFIPKQKCNQDFNEAILKT